MRLDELKPGPALVGLEPERVRAVLDISVIASNAVQVHYHPPDGAPKERFLVTADNARCYAAILAKAYKLLASWATYSMRFATGEAGPRTLARTTKSSPVGAASKTPRPHARRSLGNVNCSSRGVIATCCNRLN